MLPSYAGRNRLAPDFELRHSAAARFSSVSFRGKTVIPELLDQDVPAVSRRCRRLASLGKALSATTRFVLMTISTDETLEDARATLHPC